MTNSVPVQLLRCDTCGSTEVVLRCMCPVKVPVGADREAQWDLAEIDEGNVEEVEIRCDSCGSRYCSYPDGIYLDDRDPEAEDEDDAWDAGGSASGDEQP